MPPPMPSNPAANPVNAPSTSSARMIRGSIGKASGRSGCPTGEPRGRMAVKQRHGR
jgi:hypothetical protein